MNNTILYTYDFEEGGIADFIKFLIHTIRIVNCNSYNLCIDILHPIKKYIAINEKYIRKKLNFYKISHNDKNLSIVDIVERQNYVNVNSLCYYAYGLKNNINDIDFHNNFDYDINIYDYLTFNVDNFFSNYIVIHIRFGDSFLEKNKIDLPYIDKRNIKENYIEIIKNILDKNEKTLLITDNNLKKREIFNNFIEYKNLSYFDEEIVNISFKFDDDFINSIEYDKLLINTIIDFLYLINSKEIHAISYSGFSIISHYISKNKLIKYYD